MRSAFLPSLPLSLVLVAASSGIAVADESGRRDGTPDSGLTEEARRSLVQLDVAVQGPSETIATLTSDDFELTLGGRKIRQFTVDRFCSQAPASPVEQRPELVVQAEPPPLRGVSYLFYFDQHHLTFGGRQRSLELARELIDELIQGGSRATLISSGRKLRTFAPLTSDRRLLLEAIDTIENDPEQWDSYPMGEDGRVQNVQDELESYLDSAHLTALHDRLRLRSTTASDQEKEATEASVNRAVESALDSARHVARDYQKEEWARTDRALSRFSAVLGRMTGFDVPRAVIYFADTMRATAGAHYLHLIAGVEKPVAVGLLAIKDPFVAAAGTQTVTETTVPSFDHVIEEAAGHRVRLYTVQAEGLVARNPQIGASNGQTLKRAASPASATNQRFTDAESSLVSFAVETGGRAFLKGVSAKKIAEGILDDMACVYVISFDPEGFSHDRPFPVRVRTRKPGVTTRTRGLLVIQSDSSRLTSRLTAAFAAPEEILGSGKLVSVMIPTGFHNGKYSALVQVVLPGSSDPRVGWDIGISVVSGGRVRQKASGSISVTEKHVPVVFEADIDLPPGPWELTAVAHDSVMDEITTGLIEGDWPDPSGGEPMVGPIALLQPVHAVFLRDGAVRRRGSLGRGSDEPIRTDRPTALVGVVCGGRAGSAPLRVGRRLIGEDSVEFPTIDLSAGRDRCAVVNDVIPAGTMTSGMFRYELRVRSDEEEVAAGVRELAALDPS